MKRFILFTGVVLCLVILKSAAFSENYILSRFRLPQQQDRALYLPGGIGDELTTCTYFQRSWDPVNPSGGWLANQFKAPDIATPPVEGPEGGNALYGNSDDSDSTRKGYWIQFGSPVTSSFTFEVFFYLTNLNPAHAEHKMQNLVSSFWMSDEKAVELRYFGSSTTLIGMEDKIQVMTNDGGVEHNITSTAGVITADKWHYAAVVYDHAASEISFYLADASDAENITPGLIGTADPNWESFSMHWLCLAAWPNPAGSCRDISGYIDAFGFTFEALVPENFLLLNPPDLPPPPTRVQGSWNLYQ